MTPADRRRVLIEYLRMKADECDWHGVCDAANDLRELEAKYPLEPSRVAIVGVSSDGMRPIWKATNA